MIHPRRHRRYRSFTLVEMLVVLAIIAILAVLSMPAVKGVLGSMDLKGGAGVSVGQFDLARQTATTRNIPTELRIYQDANTMDPYGSTGSPVPAYRISAVVISTNYTGGAADEFVSTPVSLPGDIVYDQQSAFKYSTLLDGTNYPDANNSYRTVAQEATGAPALVANRPYVKVTFLPNGSVSLPLFAGTTNIAGSYCISLRNFHAKTTGTAPGSDYVTLVLDPGTSHVRFYEPGPQ